MDKIKKALEKARIQREADGSAISAAHGQAGKDLPPIEYTHTQSFDVSDEVLRESRLLNTLEHSDYTDSFKLLRTQVLQRMQDNDWSVLGVTSTAHGAGKTLTALNLGISIALEVEYTVLVVDADLRNPSVHEYFGLSTENGLSDYLTKDVPLSDMLLNPKSIGYFVILPGGEPLHSSTEMMASPKMATMVKELKNRYPKRIILFDLPPVFGTADVLAFAPYIDAALLVVEDSVTKEKDLKEAVDILSVTNIIGTVLNKSS